MNEGSPGTRTQLWRMMEVHERIRDGSYPNCRSIAEALEVTQKTIQRDIAHMRDFLKLPLEYDEKKHGYYYSENVDSVPLFEVNAGELTVLFLIRQALEPVRGTELEASVWALLSRVTLGAEERVRFSWRDAERVFSRKTSGQAVIEAKVLGRLGEAVMRRREIRFQYRKMGAKVAESRSVRPYHLGEVHGCWYLIGHDVRRESLRTFALPRVSGVRVLQGSFDRPIEFDGKRHLEQSFGIWTDLDGNGTLHEVVVELNGYAARLAEERRWHPSQQLKRLQDDLMEVRFEVSRLEDMVRWVLGWGSMAQVRAPHALVEAVEREVRMMAAALGES